MSYQSVAVLLFSVPALAFACGGKTSGSGSDAGPGSSSSSGGESASSSGSSSGGEALDATPVTDSPAPIVCKVTEMGFSSSPCEAVGTETCSDGTTYSVDCRCPQDTCTCTAMGGTGGSGGTVMYGGCGGCSFGTYLFSRCGFPM